MKPLFPDTAQAPGSALRADLQSLCGVLEDLALVRLPPGPARAHLDGAVAGITNAMRAIVLDAQVAPLPRAATAPVMEVR